jgi:hypothetical protein
METEIKVGDDIAFRIIPGYEFLPAIVVSINDATLVLRTYSRVSEDVTIGKILVIPEAPYSDFENYAEIEDIQNDILFLKRRWTGKRAFFRVDDVLPVVARKIVGDVQAMKPRIISVGARPPEPDFSDGSINPHVWSMLQSMQATLEFLLEKMYLDSGGHMPTARVPVNLSASGIKLTSAEKMEVGDIGEIKIWLPIQYPIVIVAYGEVVRSTPVDGSFYEVAFRFLSMEADVQDELSQYTFRLHQSINSGGNVEGYESVSGKPKADGK